MHRISSIFADLSDKTEEVRFVCVPYCDRATRGIDYENVYNALRRESYTVFCFKLMAKCCKYFKN